jgi:flagellar protein FliJ
VSGTTGGHDRGLHAVARVREVRERDSRVGLVHADREHRAALATVAELEGLVADHAAPLAAADGVPAAEWAARRTVLGSVAAAARRSHRDAEAAATVRTAAEEHWRSDRSRLRAVELLLERRADERRAEAARAEARLLDDLGGQRWLRAQHGEARA